jgi:hypothetical protein
MMMLSLLMPWLRSSRFFVTADAVGLTRLSNCGVWGPQSWGGQGHAKLRRPYRLMLPLRILAGQAATGKWTHPCSSAVRWVLGAGCCVLCAGCVTVAMG